MDAKIAQFEELQSSIAQQRTRLEVAVSKHYFCTLTSSKLLKIVI